MDKPRGTREGGEKSDGNAKSRSRARGIERGGWKAASTERKEEIEMDDGGWKEGDEESAMEER